MKACKQTILFVSLLLILWVNGCWIQEDTITIIKDGSVTFRSVVTIPDEKHEESYQSIEEDQISRIKEDASKAGWTIELRWISKEGVDYKKNGVSDEVY